MKRYAWMGLVLLGACWQPGVQGSGHAKTELRSATGFQAVEVSGALTAEVSIAAEPRVEIGGDDNLLALIDTEVHGEVLAIRSRGNMRSVTPLVIRVWAPALTAVRVEGASAVTVHGVRGDQITLEASGASKLEVDGAVRDLVAEASGASTLALARLSAGTARASAGGASTVVLDVTRELTAHASGASTVCYSGDPASVKKDISGASSLEKR